MITTENWTHSYYKTEKIRILISLGGEPQGEGVKELYFVTTLDNEDNEIGQTTFELLENAVEFINMKFSHLSFVDQTAVPKGCSSCEAR